jgi:hypothetical protein
MQLMGTPVTLGPSYECVIVGGMKSTGSVSIGVAGENVGNLIMDGKKSLHLGRRLEAFHDLLSEHANLWGLFRLR